MRTFATQRQKLVERRHILLRHLVLSTPATVLVFHGGLAAFSPFKKISFISGTALKRKQQSIEVWAMGKADQERDVRAHWSWKLEATLGVRDPVLVLF